MDTRPRVHARVVSTRPRTARSIAFAKDNSTAASSRRPSTASQSLSKGSWDGMLDSAFTQQVRGCSMQSFTEQILKIAAMRIWEHHDCIVASQRQEMRTFGFTSNSYDEAGLQLGESKLVCNDSLRDAAGYISDEHPSAPKTLQPKFPNKPPPEFGDSGGHDTDTALNCKVDKLEPKLLEESSPHRRRPRLVLQEEEHEPKSDLPGCCEELEDASKPALPGCPEDEDGPSPRDQRNVKFDSDTNQQPERLEHEVRDTSKKSNKSQKSTSSWASIATSKSSISFFKENTGGASKVWTFLEEPDSSIKAWWFAKIWNYFIGIAVVFCILESTNPPVVAGFWAGVVQAVIEVIMLVEWLVRLIVSHNVCRFIKNSRNILDLVAVCPLCLRIAAGFVLPGLEDPWMHYALVCSAPLLRLLKMVRRFRKFHLFVEVIKMTMDALQVLLFLLMVLVMFFSCIIYIIEPKDNIDSLPTAMWMSIVTVTTVGYGDVTPKTLEGRACAGLLVLSSVLYMAMPISIVGDAFTKTWADRHRLLMMVRTKERLTQFGYSATDMPKLFNKFDDNGNGELSIDEFTDMIGKMGVGMKEKEAAELFEVFDEDGSGAVDEQEFMKALFPKEYRTIYGRRGSVVLTASGTRVFE